MDTIASRIKFAMEQKNMKQSDLVKLTGIGKSSISTYLSGSYEPKQKNIYKLAKALNVNESWLMGNDVPMARNITQPILNIKDNLDIKKDLDSLMGKLSNSEYGPAAYDGEELSPESAELFRDELEIALKRLKIINKEKYNPNKNKQ